MPKSSGKVAKASEGKSTQQKKVTTTKKAVKGSGQKPVGKAKSAPENQIKKKNQLAKRNNPLFVKKTRNFGIGNHIQPKRDLSRFMRWPKYIRIQRQKRILLQRLKIPGTINQFNLTADKNTTAALFKLLSHHRPEDKKQKKQRLLGEAAEIVAEQKKAAEASKEKGEKVKVKASKTERKKPKFVKFGLKHVTALVESRKARLVIIAHDVDPLELVLWLPTLCKKKDVPYIIVKGKANLGRVVHQKTAAALCITDVNKEYQKDLDILIQKARENYNDKYSDVVRLTGGQVMGAKHLATRVKLDRAKAKELKSAKLT